MIKFASSMLLFTISLSACSSATSKAEDQVRYVLADGDAAKFRNVRQIDHVTCGEVNMKNAFGAYVGYAPFVVENGKPTIANMNLSDKSVPALMSRVIVGDDCRLT